MKKSIQKPFVVAALITSILGTLGHFAYGWSGNARLVGLITAVNESTWEHMKLLFFPMLIVSLIQIFLKIDEYSCLLSSLLTGNLTGTALIPVLFYTYTGILGTNIDFINIAIYYICVIAAYFVAYKSTKTKCNGVRTNILLFATFVLILLFFIFTYYPPKLAIFESPI